MEFEEQQAVALLARTPATLDALLRDLPETWTHTNEGGETFSPFDVVAHLIQGERTDWLVRTNIILEHGVNRPFDKFDRFGYQRENKDRSLAELLDEFSRLRAENIEKLRALNLSDADLNKRGKHPALGEVQLRQLLATWVVHDMTHLHQISRTLAHQYRQAVGPWTVYLGVLNCNGHSS